jgi:SAM-dependent methyltransferase
MLKKDQLGEPEIYFPLKIYVCKDCRLVQLHEVEKPEHIFNCNYTYFSSYSSSWLAHAERYVSMMVERFGFDSDSQVIEIASNDGYLLQYFQQRGIPVLGVDPSENTAEAAKRKGIETIVDFFSNQFAEQRLVKQGVQADLIVGNNVLAHVPNINDFVLGMKTALKPDGVITMEFPHLLHLVANTEFDTIYHEHYSYLSLGTVQRIFASQGLEIFDVDELPTHGGSLRIYAKHAGNKLHKKSLRVMKLVTKEVNAGMLTDAYYEGFQGRVEQVKYNLLSFLIQQKLLNKKVVAYGAAGKGNTLLNYCGVKGTDLIHFVVDKSEFKQGKFLPGSHIPVVSEEEIAEYKPDYVLILPWNLKEEISSQLDYISQWGGQFVVPIPNVQVFSLPDTSTTAIAS